MDKVDDVKKQADHDYISRTIREYFAQKLLDTVDEIEKKKSMEEIYKDQVLSDNE